MSAPLVPNKTCYTNLQDNRSQVQNNNENLISTGDTNANQILTHSKTPEDEGKQRDEIDGMENVYLGGSKKLTQLGKASVKPEDCGEESQGVKRATLDFSQQHARNRAPNEDRMTDGTKDMLKTTPVCHGQHQLNLKSNMNESSLDFTVSSDREAMQTGSQDKLKKVVETEGTKDISLGRFSSSSNRTESFAKEYIGSLSYRNLLSASLDSHGTSCHVIGSTEKSQKTPTVQNLGLAFHPLNNTSEEKKIVFYAKPSTSEIKKTNIPEFQTDLEKLSNFNKQSTWHPTYVDHLNLAGKPQEISNISEAQFTQEGLCRKSEMLQSIQQKTESIMLVELVGCQSKGGISSQDEERRGRETRESHLQDTCNRAEGPLSNQAEATDRLLTGSMCPVFSSENSANANRTSRLDSEGYAIADKDQQPEFPVASPPVSDKFNGKSSPNRNRNADEAHATDFQVGSDYMSFVHTVHPPGGKFLKAMENKAKPAEGKPASSTEPALENQTEETVPAEHASYPDGDNNFLTSRSEAFVEGTATSSLQSRQTATERKQHPDEVKESCKTLAATDAFLCVPTPFYPVAAANINSQPVGVDCNLKNLYAIHGDRLLPSPVLSPMESTQLLNISTKTPIKTICNSGIPKPVLIHSKPSPTNRGEVESNYSEKPEEKIETKPILPKPKHVRPKIITYIRRSPQAMDRLDTPFEASGLSYGTSACNIPMPKEQRTLSSDNKPSNIFYDKFKPDLQNPRLFGPGLMVSGIKPPAHPFAQMNEKFLQQVGERPGKEEFCSPPYAHYEVPSSFYRSTMILKPHLGLGAVSRLPSTKSRILIASQRSSASCLHPQGQVTTANSLYHPDASEDLKKGSIPNAAKSNLPKPYQSGLRPPGYARLPAAKLAAFGFVRSSSVSSISSHQSSDSGQSDPHKTANRISGLYNAALRTADLYASIGGYEQASKTRSQSRVEL
ncbi:microtubule-associated tumor suppressor candidate 2-like [Rhinatrema bivittatum]|uniref:microtubule-associated tumor suppressor candidate 2-like n=1 Tax=Rhinatrema bivittatum TaxID=194408 RepID=UPI00112D936E|nr:microtubule-associated tumor suppressor candidate 2-like [Rhinatrema bivittatum]